MVQAYIHEMHPVSTLSGAVTVSRISLLGWGALISSRPATQTTTEAGRLWWRFTSSTNLFELFRDPNYGSGDLVASGTVSGGLVTLSEANSSGITSPASPQQIHVTNGTQGTNPTEDGTGDLIVNFCDEDDLNQIYRDVANELDSTDKWLGLGTRFEGLIGSVQVDTFNPMLRQYLAQKLNLNTSGIEVLTAISNPRQLAPVLARHCVARLYERRGSIDEDALDMARKVRAEAERILDTITIAIDYERDGIVDVKQSGQVVRVIRG